MVPRESLETRRTVAVAGAIAATQALAKIEVQALVIGSLARGTLSPVSDVDFLITKCPRNLKYAIEGIVEDALNGLTFDVIYMDEVPRTKLPWFLEGAVDASQLR